MGVKGIWPPSGHLPVTGPVDTVNLYYAPVIGQVLRRRAAWIHGALAGRPPDTLLEVGYGSGILLPSLARYARGLFGADIHGHASEVAARLAELGIDARLVQADAERLPFTPNAFGAVVIVSTLSFVGDAGAALREAKRVLRPGGRLVALIPRTVSMADRAWEFVTRRSTTEDFGERRWLVDQAVSTELPTARRLRKPHLVPAGLAPYELIVADKPLVPAPVSPRQTAPRR
jgi:SAM-dependent methyltransferase